MALIGQAIVVSVVTDELNGFKYVKEIRCVTASQQHNLDPPGGPTQAMFPPCRSGWMKSPMDPSTHSMLL